MPVTTRVSIGGWLGLPAPRGRVRLDRGVVEVEASRVASVRTLGQGESMPAVDLGGDGAVVLPGFIDTHLHLPQWHSIGAEGLTLLDWLERVIFPAEARWADADFAGTMGAAAAKELISFGTTGIAAYGTVHQSGTAAAMEAVRACGLRAAVGQVLMDRRAPVELVRPAEQLLREAREMQARAWGGRVEHAITPRFAVSCSAELLSGAGALARSSGALVQTHLSEMREECALISELFGGKRYTEVYRDAGLLGARSVLGHGVWLDELEQRMLAETGSVVAHCPSANLFLSSGMMDLDGLTRAGVRLALGSDVAAGSDRSMPRVARWMIETARARALDHPPSSPASRLPDASQAWWMITGGNAGLLGWPDSGRLERGCWADVVIARPTRSWGEGSDAALAGLLYGWDERWIDRVLVAGEAR